MFSKQSLTQPQMCCLSAMCTGQFDTTSAAKQMSATLDIISRHLQQKVQESQAGTMLASTCMHACNCHPHQTLRLEDKS